MPSTSHISRLTSSSMFTIVICLLVGSASIAKEAAPPVIPANNAAKLKASVGKAVAVAGKVSSTSVSKSGHHFINFVSSDLTVICFKENVGKFPKGGPAKSLKGQEVTVVGKLELYRKKPQIKLISPDQVRKAAKPGSPQSGSSKTPSLADIRVDKTSGSNNPPSLSDVKVGGSKSTGTKFELKQIGKTSWVSPAGLKYKGKDPQGHTRVEHVLRHAADQPRRKGSHGVFDGGNDKALATVDEAWQLVKKKKLQPKNEGRSSVYNVSMGRRIGYLGGQSGAKQRKPALKRVRIVVRKDTSEVITAFPVK